MTLRSWFWPGALAFALAPALAGCGDDDGDSPGSAGGPGAPGGGGAAGGAQADALLARLGAVEGLSVNEVPSEGAGQRWFVLSFRQPLDHDDPAAGTFEQRMVLLHRDEQAPFEFALEGYGYASDKPRETELTAAFGANQLRVEHRFFNASRPDPASDPPWALLTIRQAAADHHRVAEAFRAIYAGPWFSDGASKGGMTALYHRRFYPDDVDATVAYVAPNSLGTNDPRYPAFLAAVGDPACRQRIVDVQRAALSRRAEIMPLVEAPLAAQSYTFASVGGFEPAFEHAVQEFRFAFWQYGSPADCAALPDPAGEPAAIAEALADLARSFSDAYLDYFAPYYYQAATQLGQYGPLEQGLEDLIKFPGTYNVTAYPPLGAPEAFDPGPMVDMAAWVSSQAKRVLLIYGELDPWTAGAFDPGASPDVRRFVAPGGNHGANIGDLPEPDRAAAFGLLEAWLGVRPASPGPATPAASARAAGEAAPARWQRRRLDQGPL